MHWIRDQRFRAAIADYLRRERPAVAAEARALAESLPFRKSEEA
jgi:predicted N-acyltransferase